MTDSTIKKINAATSPRGSMGQRYLVAGRSMSMRLWEESPGPPDPQPVRRDYETLGYVIQGRAELELEGQRVTLEAGDSWLVPPTAVHRYRILDEFTAIESTCPPARVDHRDTK